MAKISKRMRAIREKIDPNANYQLNDAFALLKEVSNAKFEESVDVAVNLGVDAKKSDQAVRGATILPHGSGRTMRAAIAVRQSPLRGPAADAAKEAGAEIVGFEDLAESIKQKTSSGEKLDFDILIASPDAMRLVGQLGRVLGPRGLMPNPKVGTVTPDVAQAVKNAKAGQVSYRTDKAGIIHCTIGKAKFDVAALRENLEKIIADLRKLKPSTAKGAYFKKIVVSTTMGPGLSIDTGLFK